MKIALVKIMDMMKRSNQFQVTNQRKARRMGLFTPKQNKALRVTKYCWSCTVTFVPLGSSLRVPSAFARSVEGEGGVFLVVEEEEVEGVAGAPLSSVFLVAEEDDMVVAAGALGLMGGSMDLMDLGDSIGRRRGVDPVGASAAVGFDSPTKSVGLKFRAYGVVRAGVNGGGK